MCRMVGGRRHTMSSVDVTTFVIYSLILCAVAQWNLKPTEALKIEGGGGGGLSVLKVKVVLLCAH